LSECEAKFDDPRPNNFQQVGNAFNIVGTSFRLRKAQAFASAAFKAHKKGWHATIELEREPTNKKDKFAIKVYGVCEVSFLGIGRKSKRWHIGYLPKSWAWRYATELPPAYPIGARLWRIYRGAEGDIAVTIIALFGQSPNQQNEERPDFDIEE